MVPSQDSIARGIQQRAREREDSVVFLVGTSDKQRVGQAGKQL